MKKGNIQLNESILVMFFVLIIIAMGLVVFYRFQLNSIENYEMEYREKQIVSLLLTLPKDFEYSYVGQSQNAIDSSRLFSSNLDYGFKKIILEQVYPESEKIECTISNYPDCNYFVVYEKTSPRLKNVLVESKPVSVYYPIEDKFKVGKLIVEVYY